jgi:hypothetical protein
VFNELQSSAGKNGSRGLYLSLRSPAPGNYGGGSDEQNDYIIQTRGTVSQKSDGYYRDDQGDLYMREWIKFQPDLATQLVSPQSAMADGAYGHWRAVWEYKSGGLNGDPEQGDSRFVTYVKKSWDGNLFWSAQLDNPTSSGNTVTWEENTSGVPVPVGQWFKLEVFVHRSSGPDGRLWAAVNGQKIVDRSGPNIGNHRLPINRLMPFLVYTGGNYNAYQWVDDFEIWDRFPADASAH